MCCQKPCALHMFSYAVRLASCVCPCVFSWGSEWLVFWEHLRIEHGHVWPQWGSRAMNVVDSRLGFEVRNVQTPWWALVDGEPTSLEKIMNTWKLCNDTLTSWLKVVIAYLVHLFGASSLNKEEVVAPTGLCVMGSLELTHGKFVSTMKSPSIPLMNGSSYNPSGWVNHCIKSWYPKIVSPGPVEQDDCCHCNEFGVGNCEPNRLAMQLPSPGIVALAMSTEATPQKT